MRPPCRSRVAELERLLVHEHRQRLAAVPGPPRVITQMRLKTDSVCRVLSIRLVPMERRIIGSVMMPEPLPAARAVDLGRLGDLGRDLGSAAE